MMVKRKEEVMIRNFKKLAGRLMLLVALNGCVSGVVEQTDDATLTTYVKTQLAADKPNPLTRVGVETKNGTVYLAGEVETDAEKSRAGTVASQVKGVKQVVNNLQVIKR
jgi:osmotically-inducible protein OsmY